MTERRDTEKRDIFISYSRANTDFARDLYAKLQALGFTLWRDRNDMIGGENWWQQIQEAIRGVQNMVLVMSPDALRSEVVADEWRYARQVGTRVIPVLAEDVDFSTVKRWMKKRDWYDFREGAPERDLIWEKFIALLRKPYERRRVPFTAPAKPEHYVERPGIFQRAKALLLRESDADQENTVALTTAFRGGGGFGKTTLAIALCHDPEVRERFDDGVLFIVLGEQPNVVALLNDQIALISGERPAFTDLNAAAARFRELVDGTDMLIVLDDVWDEAHAKPFKEGERAVRLITSRSAAITNALGARGENALEVSQMALDEAAELLLTRLAPEQRPAERSQFIAFAAELGGWALLINLAGAHIADFVENDGMSAHEALAEERARLREYGFAIFDPEDETARDRAIGANLALSLKRLGKWQERFEELAIFPEDTDVPPAAIGKLWRACAGLREGDTKEALRAMQRLSLFAAYQMSEASEAAEPQDQTSKPRKFVRLHDVIRKYLRGRLGARLPELHKKFLGAYGVENWADLPRDEPYLWDYLAYHLLEAHKRAELRAALLDCRYLQAKLDARDANALLSDFDTFLKGGDDKPVRLVRQAVEMSAHVLTEDKAALAHQLYGRLYVHAGLAEIAALRAQSAPHALLPLDEPTHLQAGGHLLRTLRGHVIWVNGALELRDGRLLSWSLDRTLRLWAADGTEIAVLRGHEWSVTGALELRDGRLLSWSDDGTLRLWAADGTERAVLREHESLVSGALELRDGRLLSWSADKTLRLWAADGTEIAVLRGHEHEVTGARELRDGRLLSWDYKTLRLWAADGTGLKVLRGHEWSVTGALELRDGRLLSWSEDKTLRLWAADGTEIAVLRGHEREVMGALELRDGRLLSWSGGWDSDETLRLWAADGTEIAVLRGHEGVVRGALELRDGRLLSWSLDQTLRLWAADGAETVLRGHEGEVRGARELRDGRLLSWSDDWTLRLWAADGTELAVLRGHERVVLGALELRDGRLLSWDYKTLRLWAADGTEIAVLRGHEGSVLGARELRDGRLLSWSEDKTLRLWAADGTERAVLRGHEGSIKGARELRDGRLLSWSEDKTLRLWAADGTEIAVLRGHEWRVSGALELRDGRLLSWSADKTLRLWAADGTERAVLRGHGGRVWGALELQDGRLLSWDHETLRLWAADGTERAVLRGHEDAVSGALELRDGRLLSWSEDKTLRLWAADGTERAVLRGHEHWVSGARELRDGRLLSWADDKTLRLWAADGTERAVLRGHEGSIEGALELRDGRLLSWSRDKTLRLWAADGTPLGAIQQDASSSELRAWFVEHGADWGTFIEDWCALAPERGLLAWHGGAALHLCRAETGEELDRFYADSEITVACFLQGGAAIALGCENGQVIFLKVNL